MPMNGSDMDDHNDNENGNDIECKINKGKENIQQINWTSIVAMTRAENETCYYNA